MFRIVALGSGRKFFTHPGTLAGGGLRFGEEPFKYFSWAADVLLESGELHSTESNYRVTTSTIGGMILAYVRTGAFTARAGAGLRVGLAASTPTAQFPGTSSLAPWGWPLGALCFSLRGGHAVFDLSGEAGYVVLPVRSGTSMSGGWFSAQFGIGFIIEPKAKARESEDADE
jgi:hypothetical protein